MDEYLEHGLKHLAADAAKEAIKGAAQGAGCLVTLFAMLSGIAVLSTIVAVLFV